METRKQIEDGRRQKSGAKRKVVQVTSNNGALIALCNDGSLWQRHSRSGPNYGWDWLQLEGVPQE